jgi:hypothetical protein
MSSLPATGTGRFREEICPMPEGPAWMESLPDITLALDTEARKVPCDDICGRRAVPFLPAML